MSFEFVSVNGLGGAFELGMVQENGTLLHRTGSLNLGAPVVRGNRPLLGWKWEDQFTKDYREWERFSPAVIMGNPPCSAWSTLTRKDLRGSDAKVLSCTQEVIDYASLQKTPPLLVAIESVQQAYSTGRAYYQKLRQELTDNTGYQYDLVWVMQSNASLGGASVRKRCFIVFTRIPFGIEYAQPDRVPRLGDVIRDLEGLDLTMQRQAYARPATWWTVNRRSDDGVDGHDSPAKLKAQFIPLMNALETAGIEWPVGGGTDHAVLKLYQQTGALPEPWDKMVDYLERKNWSLGMNQTGRWDPDKLGRVVTGSGPAHSVHYTEHRPLTYRECARLQGFPDTWQIWPARDYNKLSAVWGKGVPVDAGRWISRWIRKALEGEPGTMQGKTIDPNERHLDVTNSYKFTLRNERLWEHQRYVPMEHTRWARQMSPNLDNIPAD